MTKVLQYDGNHINLEWERFSSSTSGNFRFYTHSNVTDELVAVTPADEAAIGSFNGNVRPLTDTSYYAHTDHQGSIRALTNQTGQVVNDYTYDSYGRSETAVETFPQRFRYTGREYDEDLGLYHYRARVYDPDAGRFLQEDPIGFAAGDANVYNYVGNNPLNFTDPSGKIAATQYAKAAANGAVAGAAIGAMGTAIFSCSGMIISKAIELAGNGPIRTDGENCTVTNVAKGAAYGAAGGAAGGAALAAVVRNFYSNTAITALFGNKYFNKGKFGVLNTGDFFRIGYSFHAKAGKLSFSIRGKSVEAVKRFLRAKEKKHYDIFDIEL